MRLQQFNLYTAESRASCEPYGASADVWSLGVLVLRMVSYFPNEKCAFWHDAKSLVSYREGFWQGAKSRIWVGIRTKVAKLRWHRLQPDFALVMHQENMPFKWMIAEMMVRFFH